MSANVELLTAEQLAARGDDGRRCELLRGELRMMSPAGSEHGRIAMRLGWRVARYVEDRNLGMVFAAETGFLLESDPDTVRAPDMAFVRQTRVDQVGSIEGFWPGAPDLAVEVVSPNDSYSDVEEKALGWLESGACEVWVVDSRQRHVTVYRGREDIVVRTAAERFESPELLPGWSLVVSELFA